MVDKVGSLHNKIHIECLICDLNDMFSMWFKLSNSS